MTRLASIYQCGCRGKSEPCKKDCRNEEEHEEKCREDRDCLECDRNNWEKEAHEGREKLSKYDRVELLDRYFLKQNSSTPEYCHPINAADFLKTAVDASLVKKVVELYERACLYKVSYDYNGKFGTALQADLLQLLKLNKERAKVELVGKERQQKLAQLKKDILG